MAYMGNCLFQASGRVVSSLVQVYKRVGKSDILVCKKAHKGQKMHLIAVKRSRTSSAFVIYSYSVSS